MNSKLTRLSFSIAGIVMLCCAFASSIASARDRSNSRDYKPKTPDASSAPSDGPSLSQYDVLLTRNIFSREQPRPKVEYKAPPPVEVKSEAELKLEREKRERELAVRGDADIVLTGLVVRDELGYAILEDRRSGKTITVKTGEMIGSGKVGGINMQALEFVSGDKTNKIVIGTNLQGYAPIVRAAEIIPPTTTTTPVAGTPAATTPGAPAADGTGTTPAPASAAGTGSTGAANEAGLSLIEKMRLRRLKEGNR